MLSLLGPPIRAAQLRVRNRALTGRVLRDLHGEQEAGGTAASVSKGAKMTGATLETESNLWPCVLLFSGAYLILSAVSTAVLMIFDLNANTGVAVGVLVAATATAARKFVLDHRRALRSGEQLRFAVLALIATILVTLVQLVAAVLIVTGKDELPALIEEVQALIAGNTSLLTFVVAAVALVFFAILYFTSGWFSRLFDKRLAATGKI